MSLFTEASSALWSYVKGQLTDKAEDTFEAARDYKKLEQDVRALAEQYQPRFETLSLTEEFDFEGLNDYFTANLRQEVSACFNAPDRDQREAASRLLFNSACYYAGADTQAKKDTVQAYLNMVLEVVEHHFLERVDGKEWFLCGRTVDETVDAVETFLQQHATQITEAIRYHGSFEEYIDNLQPPWSSENRFHYRNPSLGFYGREQEIAELNDFLNRDGDILWMAVTGDGGVGKSKLLYHFCAQVNNLSGWKTVWLSTNSSKRLNDYQSWYYPQGLLVVADYAGEMAERLGDWLSNLSEVASDRRPGRLRLILLEREPLGEVTPLWYQPFTGGRERRRAVERYCADPAHPCLNLTGPGDEALKRLVTDYARSKGKPEGLTEAELAFVLEKAHEIDHGNSAPRPLVTLFLADAVLDGREYTHWDMDELLENIIDRYREHWLKTVCNGDKQLFKALEDVLVYATAVGGWNLTELPGPLEEPSRTLRASAQVLKPLVCAVNEEPTFRGWLSPLEPDLIGEFYVLDYLNDKRYAKTTLTALVQLFWEQAENFWYFLNRCIQNYCKEKRFQALFRDGLAAFQSKPEDTSIALPFAMLLVNLTLFQSPKEAAQTVSKLEALAIQHPGSDEITLTYAVGLVNLSCDQSPEEAAHTVNTLKELSDQHSGSDEFALEYAMGLFNLSNKQSPEAAAQTVTTLKELSEEHSGSDEITLRYANGLVILSAKQSPEEAALTVSRLETLAGQHSGSDEIAYRYAVGLLKLSLGQSQEAIAKAIRTLESLAEQYPDSEEMNSLYTKIRDILAGR